MSLITDAIRAAGADDEELGWADAQYQQDPVAVQELAVVTPQKFKLMSFDELEDMPEPEWLVENVVESAGMSVLYGPPGCGKSFLGLDFALCVATGTPWNGRTVVQGDAVYMVGEGLTGFYQRVDAWLRDHPNAKKADLRKHFHVLRTAVRLVEREEQAKLWETVKGLEKPKLLVIDTLARAFVGGDENSSKDISSVIAATDAIKDRFSMHVMYVHHTGKDGKTERGSVALRGAADTMLHLKPAGNSCVTLWCDKQKNAAEFKGVSLRLTSIAHSAVLQATGIAVQQQAKTHGIRDVPTFGGGSSGNEQRGGGYF